MTTADVAAQVLGSYNEFQGGIKYDGTIVKAIEVFNKTNEFMKRMPQVQCNRGNQHLGGVVTSMPKAYINIVGADKPVTTETREFFLQDCVELVSNYALNEEIAGGPEKAAISLLEKKDRAIEVISQLAAEKAFYGTGEREPKGLSSWYNSLGSAINGTITDHCISMHDQASGETLTSAYLATFSTDMGLHGLIPGEGSALEKYAGFQIDNPIKVPIASVGTTPISPGQTHQLMNVQWMGQVKRHIGMFLGYWGSCGRLCNINMKHFGTASEGDIFLKLFQLTSRVMINTEKLGLTQNSFIFVHPHLETELKIALARKGASASASNYGLSQVLYNGLPVLSINGVLVLKDQNILYNSEERVS